MLAPDSDPTPLATLGISVAEELVYRGLLRAPGSTAETLAQALQLAPAQVATAVAELERKGFATYAPERVPRLYATPPDIAVEALLLQRQNDLQRARLAIADLQREQLHRVDGQALVEIVDADPAAQTQPYAQCHERARDEVLCLIRPPFLVSTPSRLEDTRAAASRRGVRYRNIVHPDTLALPGWTQVLQDDIARGEEVRLLSDVPFKMIVADRELALLPLSVEAPTGPMLLLRGSAVLDALCTLFDQLWLKAVPIRFAADGSPTLGAPASYPPQLQALIPLLAAGSNDKTVAERLGISERTLMRRIDTLYQTLNARSRFQAGWLAALQSLTDGETPRPASDMAEARQP